MKSQLTRTFSYVQRQSPNLRSGDLSGCTKCDAAEGISTAFGPSALPAPALPLPLRLGESAHFATPPQKANPPRAGRGRAGVLLVCRPRLLSLLGRAGVLARGASGVFERGSDGVFDRYSPEAAGAACTAYVGAAGADETNWFWRPYGLLGCRRGVLARRTTDVLCFGSRPSESSDAASIDS